MMSAFTVCCGPSQLNGNRSGKESPNRHLALTKRPAVIGAVPLYYLLRAGRELRAALPGFVNHVQTTIDGEKQVSVSENLRQATESTVEELTRRAAEIEVLQARCKELENALLIANRRVSKDVAG